MALLGIIRRRHLRDQVSLREIYKRLGISRNTVMPYLRAETVEPAYTDRHSPTSLDKYAFKLSAWLKTDTTKSRKQRRTLKQMHIDLCALGYEGSYEGGAAFGRQWKVVQLERADSASKSAQALLCVLTNTNMVAQAQQEIVCGDLFAILKGMVDAASSRGEVDLAALSTRVYCAVFGYLEFFTSLPMNTPQKSV